MWNRVAQGHKDGKRGLFSNWQTNLAIQKIKKGK